MSYMINIEQRPDRRVFKIRRRTHDIQDNLPLYILEAGHDIVRRAGPLVHRQLTFYSLARFTSGECHYVGSNDRGAVVMEKGQAIITCPGVVHAYGARRGRFVEDYVSFFGPVADRFREVGLLNSEHPIVRLRNGNRLAQIADLMLKPSLESHLRAGVLLQSVLIDARFDDTSGMSTHHDSIRNVLDRIAASPHVHFSNRELAASCGLSVSYFRRVFREETGTAPNRYCEQIRMNRACLLLTRQSSTITRIAAELGYNDPLYFSKRFSATIGLSPRAYRKAMHADTP